MKVAICSQQNIQKIKNTLKKHNFQIVTKNPDIVLCYGGDGTILYAERKYPSVPKLAIKNTNICHKCEIKTNALDKILKKIKNKKYKLAKEMKLVAKYKTHTLTALNEIQIHTKLPIRAIRFLLTANKKKFENLIGDGVIIATPFGSTGYYSATGGKKFNKGIGISFNNMHPKKIPSFVVPENSIIEIKMVRDSALLLSDNNEKYYELEQGDTITVKKAKDKAIFIQM